MNENLKEAKLKFAINRKNLLLTLTEKDVFVGKNGMAAHKCQAARDEYSYDYSQILLNTDKNLLQRKAKITTKRIKVAVTQVIEDNKKVINNELSA